jgi:hypothetical protein
VHEVRPAQPRQPIALPIPTAIKVTTLAGFAELVRQRIEKFEPADYVIHVVGEREVSLVKKYVGREWPSPDADHGRAGRVRGIRNTTTGLTRRRSSSPINALFAATADKDYILGIASNITDNATSVSEDNGISQKLTVKVGMQLADTITVRPQVDLAPYRIFPECQQPISKFVFRARGGKDPRFMLKEADGGIWKITAINEVRRLLATFALEGLEIIA